MMHTNKRSPGEEREYCYKAAVKIIRLSGPVKRLSVSRLRDLKSVQLEEIGKAVRQLYDVLERQGLTDRFY